MKSLTFPGQEMEREDIGIYLLSGQKMSLELMVDSCFCSHKFQWCLKLITEPSYQRNSQSLQYHKQRTEVIYIRLARTVRSSSQVAPDARFGIWKLVGAKDPARFQSARRHRMTQPMSPNRPALEPDDHVQAPPGGDIRPKTRSSRGLREIDLIMLIMSLRQPRHRDLALRLALGPG